MAEPPPPEQSAGQISAIFLASVAILYDKFFNLTLSCRVQSVPATPALQGRITDTRRTTVGQPREARPKRVVRTALWFCHTVATGGRTAWCQRPPRAGTVAPGFRTKLSRKRGPGPTPPVRGRWPKARGGRVGDYGQATSISKWMWPVHRSKPPAIFSPLLDRSKRGSPPGRRNAPQIKRCGTNPAGGASPSPTGDQPATIQSG